ncbi:hypothetical protein V5R04_02865 [Jonesiaceae bacterium BS-20]|uniref:Uncharacterized protein n=1 Tax=Jonesiaceae bacterium BS-20 TaxID=3120821 RepID=A0AAU7DZH2_9MICO
MRDLDVLDGSNNPLVVLGKAENSRIAVEILIFALAVDGISSSNALRQGLHDLVSDFKLNPELSESEVREVCIQHLINTSGVTLEQVAKFSEVTRSLLSDLTRNFLLTVVLPAATVGQRQIIKFSRFGKQVSVKSTLDSNLLWGRLGFIQ